MHSLFWLSAFHLLFSCTGKQGPVGPTPDPEPRVKPSPSPSPKGKQLPAPAGPPFSEYTDYQKKKRGGKNCVARGRYKVKVPGTDTPVVMVVTGDSGPRTMVVALHGGGGSAKTILDQTRWDSMADRAGNMVLVVPHASDMAKHGPRWNTGKWKVGPNQDVKPGETRDDVAYLDSLVKYLKDDTCSERVLAAGFSNGGQMAQRWACQGTTPNAVMTSAGTLLVEPSGCRSLPIRAYIGTDDPIFDNSPLEGSKQPSAVESLDLWAEINGCSDKPPKVTRTAETTCKTWQGCKKPTTLCVVDDFPHGWPAPWAKRKKVECNATTEGWEWFGAL